MSETRITHIGGPTTLIEAVLARSPLADRITWLDPGEDVTLPV